MMKIVAVSGTHGMHGKVDLLDEDLLIYTGDFALMER